MKLSQNLVNDDNRATIAMQNRTYPQVQCPCNSLWVANSRCWGRFATCPVCDYPTKGGSKTRPYSASCYDFCRLGNSETVSSPFSILGEGVGGEEEIVSPAFQRGRNDSLRPSVLNGRLMWIPLLAGIRQGEGDIN